MKYIILLPIIFALNSFAEDCIGPASREVQKSIAKALKVEPTDLVVRHIGGEALDGDRFEDLVIDVSWEVFDVFLKGEAPSESSALAMMAVGLNTYRADRYEDGVYDCEVYEMNEIEQDEWQRFYDTYL